MPPKKYRSNSRRGTPLSFSPQLKYGNVSSGKKDIEKAWRHFEWATKTIPNFMKHNLDQMPNNKGYIWKGVWFLGREDSQPGSKLVLFEKIHGDILLIHEYGKHYYRLYEKRGRDKKRLIEHRKNSK